MPVGSSTPARPGQEGSVLIEVMASAVVLLIAIVALFVSLDVQTDASGDTRASSTSASLAEADQERLRSFSVPELVDRKETRTVSVAGVDYTVASSAEWIFDSTNGTESCTSLDKQADYLRLTSVVSPPADGESTPAPITIRSLIAPAVGQFGVGQGTIAVKVTGAAGQAIQGASVTISGPKAQTGTTNSLGCAVFIYVPVGAYTVKVSAAGFVDEAGNVQATGSATATQGTVNLTTVTYDRAGTLDVAFDTSLRGVVAPSTSSWLSVANSGVPSSTCGGKTGTGVRFFCSTAGPQPSYVAGSLFPFTAPYTVYSGSCPGANPAAQTPTYFTAGGAGSIVVAPGSSAALTIREPALDLTISTVTGGVPVHVRARAIDAGCTEVFDWDVTTDPVTKTVRLPDPGLPFGRYSVCADAVTPNSGNGNSGNGNNGNGNNGNGNNGNGNGNNGAATSRKYETIASVALKNATGSAPQAIDLSTTVVPAGTSGGNGACA